MSFKKCCYGLSALFFLGTFIFAVVMLAITISDYSSLTDKQVDLISNYNSWLCDDLCGSWYSVPSASDFCCNAAFAGCRVRTVCRDELKNQLDDDLSEDEKYLLIFGVATGFMLYAIFKIVKAVCRGRSRRQTYFIRQSYDNY
jgi:hypothetical protein